MRRRTTVSLRLYMLLLYVYPPAFRRRYGASMTADFADLLTRQGQGGSGVLSRAWVRALRDLGRSVPREWGRNAGQGVASVPVGVLIRDVRFASRMLFRNPGFSLTVVLTLALGIAANAAVFSLVRASLWNPAPLIREPERVVAVLSQRSDRLGNLSYPDFEDLARIPAFETAAAAAMIDVSVGSEAASVRVDAALVSPNLFETLGVRADLGRALRSADDRGVGANRVAVIGQGLWRRQFGADPGLVGSEIRLNGAAYTVVGVAPAGFRGPWIHHAPEVWVPVPMIGDFMGFMGRPVDGSGTRILDYRGYMTFEVFARLRDGVDLAAAAGQLAGVAAQIRAEMPDYGLELVAVPASEAAFDPRDRWLVTRYSRILAGIAALVLLIAVANVATLVGMRGLGRRREIALRRALGAGRGRIVSQLLSETLLLSLLAGFVGLGLLRLGLPLLGMLRLPGAIRPQPTVDPAVVAAGLLLSALVGCAIACVAGLGGTGSSEGDALRTARVGLRRWRFGDAAVVVQVAVSLVLLAGAGVLIRTLINLRAVDPGFEYGDVLVATVDPEQLGYDQDSALRLYGRLLDDLATLPGVAAVSLGSDLPLQPPLGFNILFVEGQEPVPPGQVGQTLVGPGYFSTLGIGLSAGRGVSTVDRRGGVMTAWVNAPMAARTWPGEDPLGKRIGSGPEGPWFEVVGVVDAYRHDSLRTPPRPRVYWPLMQVYGWQKGSSARSLLLRVGREPLSLLPAIRATIERLDPNLPLYRVATLRERVDGTLAQERQTAVLLGAFASLAVGLAGVGLFAVLAYGVRQRQREIGVRIAVGADAWEVRRMIVGRAMALVTLGGLLGAGAARLATGYLDSLLFEVDGFDPLTLLVTASAIVAVAAAAAYGPARRASAVDPVVALRAE